MSGHIIEVGVDPEQGTHYRIVCPDNGADCECWEECGETTHVCPECDNQDCDGALCDEALLHGTVHSSIDGIVCEKVPGCWMANWEIEFDNPRHYHLPAGRYEFTWDDIGDNFGGTLYVLDMTPPVPASAERGCS